MLKQQGWLQPWEEGQEKSIKKCHEDWIEAVSVSRPTQNRHLNKLLPPCHVMCCCWSTVFYQVRSLCSIYQEILKHFLLPSPSKLYGLSDFFFFFLHNLAPVQRVKTTTGCFTDRDFIVLDWSVSSPDLPEGCYQSNLGFSNTSAVPQAAHLHDTPHL